MTQMQEYAREHAVPISGTFELTPRCNFNCRMCYVHLAEERIPLFGREMDAAEWIRLAEERNIGYWITSALESNIGLNAIAQWCATLNPVLPQGLGTGLLFTDNIDYPFAIEGDCLRFHPEQPEPDFETFLANE